MIGKEGMAEEFRTAVKGSKLKETFLPDKMLPMKVEARMWVPGGKPYDVRIEVVAPVGEPLLELHRLVAFAIVDAVEAVLKADAAVRSIGTVGVSVKQVEP